MAPMNKRSLFVNSSENGFGAGADESGALALGTLAEGLLDDWNNFRTPITDPAVVSNVK